MLRTALTAMTILVGMAFAGQTAWAEPISLFGIAISSPLAVPECPAAVDVARWYATPELQRAPYFYKSVIDRPCYKRSRNMGTTVPIENEVVFVRFPLGTRLDVAAESAVNVLIIKDKVEWIRFATLGIGTQERDLSLLSNKFGPPTKTERVVLQNGFGATFGSIQATWSFGAELSASFDSAGSSLERGLVTLASRSGLLATEARLNQLTRGNRPL